MLVYTVFVAVLLPLIYHKRLQRMYKYRYEILTQVRKSITRINDTGVMIGDNAMMINFQYKGDHHQILVPFDKNKILEMTSQRFTCGERSYHHLPGIPILVTKTDLNVPLMVYNMLDDVTKEYFER